MSVSWWWLGVVAAFVAVLCDLHWTVLDFVMDRLPERRTEWWRDGESDASDTVATPRS
jgi:hypothetical protein